MTNPQHSRAMNARARGLASKFFVVVILLILLAFALLPFFWAVVSSFKTMGDILSRSILPKQWTFEQYTRLLSASRFPRWMFNSVFISVTSTLLGVIFSSLAGFAFAKYRFRGSEVLFWLVLATVAIPPHTTLVPLFGWMSQIGWINTYQVLILPYSANAFAIFLMRQYIKGVPDGLLDAGRIDGCSEFQLFYRVLVPVIKPAMGTISIILFLNSWNTYIWPLIMMRTDDMYTVPLGVASLHGTYLIDYGLLMSAAVLSVVPIMLLFLLLQRQFITGLMEGAIKG